jgi:hypothetical protein
MRQSILSKIWLILSNENSLHNLGSLVIETNIKVWNIQKERCRILLFYTFFYYIVEVIVFMSNNKGNI